MSDECAGCGATLPETQPMAQPSGYCSVDCLLTEADPLVGDAEVTPILSEATRSDLELQADAPDRDILPDGGPSVVSVDGAESPVPRRYAESVGRLPGAEVREE